MSQGFSQATRHQAVIRWLLSIVFIAGLAACLPDDVFPSQPGQSLIPCTPVPITNTPSTNTPAVIAASTEININIYKTTPNPLIVDLFQHAATPTPTFTPLPLTPSATPDFVQPTIMAMEQERRTLESKHAAFSRLVYEVERWTDVKILPLDDSSEASVAVTFISPELVQAVLVNNILLHKTSTTNIRTELVEALYQFSKREEIIFLVTVAAVKKNEAQSSPHQIQIPMDNMILTNVDNLSISPQHKDQNLDQPVDLSLGPAFGYLYYPMAVKESDRCKQVLDPIYNTKIVIQTDSLRVDSALSDPLTWTIAYKPLLDTGNSIYNLEFVTPEPSHLANMIPMKNMPPGSNPINWEEFAKFIWGQITLEIY